jgi:hypothetical protein
VIPVRHPAITDDVSAGFDPGSNNIHQGVSRNRFTMGGGGGIWRPFPLPCLCLLNQSWCNGRGRGRCVVPGRSDDVRFPVVYVVTCRSARVGV